MNMQLEEGERIAGEFLKEIEPLCSKVMVCGSIRRRKRAVNDIDIVAIPKSRIDLIEHLKCTMPYTKAGAKLIEVTFQEEQIDVYIADESTFETLVLIRTGSAEHNVRLCSLAKGRGWQLKANGKGLVDGSGKLITNNEKGILEALLGKYVEPEDRT
jgi:DNA polymerase/3'-5' exonuclease PolX